MEKEETAAFRDMAAAFARRVVQPLLDHESPDGDLSKVPEVLAEGERVGLLAAPRPAAPGYETGIWGRQAREQGPLLSLLLLEEVAAVCGGVALNFHLAGLAAFLLDQAAHLDDPPSRAAPALLEGGFLPPASALADPAAAKIQTTAEPKDDGFLLRGRKDFVFLPPGTETLVVFGRSGKGWGVFLVPAAGEGVIVEEAGYRMGLRACPLRHVTFSDVCLPPSAALTFARPSAELVMEYLRLHWLGLLAIGTGIARGALSSAQAYARERYQCWTEIVHHPAMRGLLAESAGRILLCEALLERAAAENHPPAKALLAAAQARLLGMNAAAQAVTDSLQVFGGYGYMEDYRMEKRFRDVNTLKHVAGGPRDLKAMIADLWLED